MRDTIKIIVWIAPALFVVAGCSVNNTRPMPTPVAVTVPSAVVTTQPGTTTYVTAPQRTVYVPAQAF
ncbi:hypothetical protein ACFW16_23695 [Inquilinus sp. NPDC058860]|uniref:hypothetical protein n=1 Tax=Inquilinus sp. NPDC058860 TaxID=3346652 RepID=UPI00368DDBF9